MLIPAALFLLMSNAVSLRRDKSILYSRNSLSILICCFLICVYSFFYKFQENGIGLFSGLFQTTCITHIFQIFVFLITFLVLHLNGFYPRKISTEQQTSIFKLLYSKVLHFNSFILNKMSEQYTIIEYSLIILFTLIGGVFLMSSNNIISIFLSLELQSYGLYILCVVYRDSERATSGGLTYFLLGGLSSCFILLAFGIIYGNSGNTGFDGLYVISNISGAIYNGYEVAKDILANVYESYYLNFSMIIMSTGFLFKISAAPFHFWSPDVYDAIPTVITTFVAVFAKISILVLLLELVHYTSNYLSPLNVKTASLGTLNNSVTHSLTGALNFSWTFTLLLSSFLSLIIGAVLGLTQFRVKRLYAYSTISHIGFILLALSVNTIESIQSFIFYLMQYSLTNVNAFILLAAIAYSLYLYIEKDKSSKNHALSLENKTNLSDTSYTNFASKDESSSKTDISDKDNSPIQLISQIKGYFYINPFICLSLALTLFSFVGIPPLIGFFAKQMVLSSALDNGYVFMVLTAILTSVVSAYYYLALVKQMFFNKTDYILNPYLIATSLKASIFNSLEIGKSEKSSAKHNTIANNVSNIVIDINNVKLSSFLSVIISSLTLVIVLFILIPQECLNMATILALIIFNC